MLSSNYDWVNVAYDTADASLNSYNQWRYDPNNRRYTTVQGQQGEITLDLVKAELRQRENELRELKSEKKRQLKNIIGYYYKRN